MSNKKKFDDEFYEDYSYDKKKKKENIRKKRKDKQKFINDLLQ